MEQIGTRYLGRTLGEMRRMQGLLQEVVGGSAAMLKDLEHLAHKIHGSGAMFGFELLSERAAEIEQIAGHLRCGEGPQHLREMNEQQLHERLRAQFARLDEVTRAAAKERGVEPNAT